MSDHKLHALFLCSLSLAPACIDDLEPPNETARPSRITVSTERTPALIAFRDGADAAWQTPAAKADGVYAFDVHGPYVVTVVCDHRGYLETHQIARTPGDDRELDMTCTVGTDEPFSVTGKMVQPGMVGLGSSASFSSAPDWEFHFSVGPEPTDVIAVSGDQIAIRRHRMFSADTRVRDVDVGEEGVALAPVAFTAPNAAAGEAVEAFVELESATSSFCFVYEGAPANAKVAPSAILNATDRQTAWMIAQQGDSRRFVGRGYQLGDPTAFTLPDPLGAVQLSTASGEIAAAWATLPDHDKLRLWAYGTTTDGHLRSHYLLLSQRFVAATGATDAVLETGIPGYLPEWQIDFNQEYTSELATARWNGDDEVQVSEVSKTINAPALRARARRLPQPRFEERPRLEGLRR